VSRRLGDRAAAFTGPVRGTRSCRLSAMRRNHSAVKFSDDVSGWILRRPDAVALRRYKVRQPGFITSDNRVADASRRREVGYGMGSQLPPRTCGNEFVPDRTSIRCARHQVVERGPAPAIGHKGKDGAGLGSGENTGNMGS